MRVKGYNPYIFLSVDQFLTTVLRALRLICWQSEFCNPMASDYDAGGFTFLGERGQGIDSYHLNQK